MTLNRQNITVLRHGCTDYNSNNLFQGQSNPPLNKYGETQIKELIAKNSLPDFEIIISSPLRRAIESSLIISEHINVKTIYSYNFIERSMGEFEGINKNDVKLKLYKSHDGTNPLRNIYYKPKNGESLIQVSARVKTGLIKIQNIPCQKILIITHGTVSKILHWLLSETCPCDFFQFSLKNADFSSYYLIHEQIIKRYNLLKNL